MMRYYELHITMQGDKDVIRTLVNQARWKFSAIDGDAVFGHGVKCYATVQLNEKVGEFAAIAVLHNMANALFMKGANVIRRKVELVIFDDRSSKVRPSGICAGDCISDCGKGTETEA